MPLCHLFLCFSSLLSSLLNPDSLFLACLFAFAPIALIILSFSPPAFNSSTPSHISVQATGPFLHIGALAAVTALSWIVAGQVARAEKPSTLTFVTQTTSYCYLI